MVIYSIYDLIFILNRTPDHSSTAVGYFYVDAIRLIDDMLSHVSYTGARRVEKRHWGNTPQIVRQSAL